MVVYVTFSSFWSSYLKQNNSSTSCPIKIVQKARKRANQSAGNYRAIFLLFVPWPCPASNVQTRFEAITQVMVYMFCVWWQIWAFQHKAKFVCFFCFEKRTVFASFLCFCLAGAWCVLTRCFFCDFCFLLVLFVYSCLHFCAFVCICLQIICLHFSLWFFVILCNSLWFSLHFFVLLYFSFILYFLVVFVFFYYFWFTYSLVCPPPPPPLLCLLSPQNLPCSRPAPVCSSLSVVSDDKFAANVSMRRVTGCSIKWAGLG